MDSSFLQLLWFFHYYLNIFSLSYIKKIIRPWELNRSTQLFLLKGQGRSELKQFSLFYLPRNLQWFDGLQVEQAFSSLMLRISCKDWVTFCQVLDMTENRKSNTIFSKKCNFYICNSKAGRKNSASSLWCIIKIFFLQGIC